LQKDIKYWLDIAEYDFETAKAMLKAGRNLYVLFACQQAVEKILKALITAKTKEFPPRIHNLVKLSELAGLILSAENKMFLEKVSYYYLEARYPEEVLKINKQINRRLANKYFDKTKEIIKWLKQEIK
jgi:HEPN domain-containing protein